MINNFLTQKITRKKIGEFVAKNATDKLTLDLGCSNSPYIDLFPNRVGFDIKKGKGVDMIGDAHSLPFENEKFEVILCTELLEHLYNPFKAIEEMHRVLKPGGKLILTTRFIFPIHDGPGDFFRFTIYGLKKMFENGWRIKEIEEEVESVKIFAVLLQRYAFQNELNKVVKAFLFLFSKFLNKIPNFSKGEFMNLKKAKIEHSIMTSGYYLILEKML